MEPNNFVFNDGGRAEAGYLGQTGDCVCRAICVASGLPYQQVYDALANGNATQRQSKHNGRKSSVGSKTARNGIMTNRKWFDNYMTSIGFSWTPTMLIGQGCKVHLKSDELPKGRLVVSVSRHMVAVVDGKIMDTYDCSRNGTRCVYGYYTYNGKPDDVEVKKADVVEDIKPDKREFKLKKLLATQKKWESKFTRAENALNKINKQIKYYEHKDK